VWRNKMRRLLFLVLSLLALTLNGVKAQADEIRITVDTSVEVGEISPYVFGANHGPWAGVSVDMQDEAAAAGLTILRWPGGNWGDQNNVREQQIDFFMLEARNFNIIPMVHVRLEGGTPEQAAELVRYANIEKGYDIRFWQIGNEPTLFDDYNVERLNTEWRAIAEAMEAVDPTITLVGPDVHQYADSTEPSYLDEMRAWLRGFLEVNGDMVDYVSVHRYPFPLEFSGPATEISAMRENVPRWATLVEILRQDIRDAVGHDMPIAITEVNSHWTNSGGGIATPDSYYNAIWWSGVFSTLIRERVDMITFWTLSTSGSNGAYGILERYGPRPTYYTYQLFRDIGTMQVVSESSDDYITVLATRRDDGAITLIITNLYEEARSVTLDLSGMSISEVNEMRVLAPELLAETVDPTTYLDGTVLEMPAQSVIRLVITVDS
jgi:hypothetical protein